MEHTPGTLTATEVRSWELGAMYAKMEYEFGMTKGVMLNVARTLAEEEPNTSQFINGFIENGRIYAPAFASGNITLKDALPWVESGYRILRDEYDGIEEGSAEVYDEDSHNYPTPEQETNWREANEYADETNFNPYMGGDDPEDTYKPDEKYVGVNF